MKETKISFRGYGGAAHARELWQALFNVYREAGCDLDDMHHLLIDLGHCQDTVESLPDQPSRFVWGCSPGYSDTSWVPESRWYSSCAKTTAECGSDELYVLVEVTDEGVTITPLHEDHSLTEDAPLEVEVAAFQPGPMLNIYKEDYDDDDGRLTQPVDLQTVMDVLRAELPDLRESDVEFKTPLPWETLGLYHLVVTFEGQRLLVRIWVLPMVKEAEDDPICHCGDPLSAHSQSSNHMFKEM